jgi:hypothetical protein
MNRFLPQASYSLRMKSRGFTKVQVWIPPTKRSELSALATRLRMEHNKSQPITADLVAIGLKQTNEEA